MDAFLPLLLTTDTRKKLSIGADILQYLQQPENPIDCEDIGAFIDGIVPWVQNSNFKVSTTGLEVMSALVQRMGERFKPYLGSVIPATVDRLGDGRDSVRAEAGALLSLVMARVVPPNALLHRLAASFNHKNHRVREELMACLVETLTCHGAGAVTISRLLPHLVRLLSDPTATVRDRATQTLIEAYRFYGDRLRADLATKQPVPPAKLPALLSRFDEVKAAGMLMPSALAHHDDGKTDDEVDRGSVKSGSSIGGGKSRASSAPPVRRGLPTPRAAAPHDPPEPPHGGGRGGLKRNPSLPRSRAAASATAAGAVDESYFLAAFEDAPAVTLYSNRDLLELMTKIRDTISDASNDWDKRVDMLRKVRAVVVAGGAAHDDFFDLLRNLETSLCSSIKDLRSQVVREACVTVAFLSQELKNRVDRLCETVLPALISLIPNGAKIISTSGTVCARFIIKHCHHHRIIPLLAREMASKSREIRRAACEFLDQLVYTWPPHAMDRHAAVIAEAIRKGICDADPEARAFSRKAYWGFAEHFKEEADKLLLSLDPSYRKLVQGDAGVAGSSSAHCLSSAASAAATVAAPKPALSSGRLGSMRRSGPALPRASPRAPPPASPTPAIGLRSNSAIDVHAARRAQARAQYASANRMRAGSGVSLPRPRKSPDTPPAAADRTPRTRGRGPMSQSQPGSRSGSPSSRLSYATYTSPHTPSPFTAPRARRRSGIPRSTGTSRDSSPSRHGVLSSHQSPATSGMATPKGRLRYGSSMTPEMPPTGRPRQVMAEKILQQSREAEHALADALVSPLPVMRSPQRKISRSYDEHSENDSEASSVCSERSFDAYRRNEMMEVGDILTACASSHWADRKEGLIALHAFLCGSQMLTGSELARATHIFSKMFMDTHTKVFTLFLDTLKMLITVHREDLEEWLYVLLTKLLLKLGSDLLGSVQSRIYDTLDTIRQSFSHAAQWGVVMRFLVDPTQTPNSKVKLSTLTYLKCLTDSMHSADDVSRDTTQAFTKIIQWTGDQKSIEIRRASSACLVAMNSCCPNHFAAILRQLPQHYRATAHAIIENHVKRAASLGGSPGAAVTPVLQSPNTALPRPHAAPPARPHPADMDDTENLNPDDVFRSLKATTDEIRKYSFSLELNGAEGAALGKGRDSHSQDSGISQLSEGEHRSLEGGERVSPAPGPPPAASPPPPDLPAAASPDINGAADALDGLSLGESDSAAMAGVHSALAAGGGTAEQRRAALATLVRLARQGSTIVWNDHFKKVLRLLVENLESKAGSERVLVLSVLTEMMRRCPLVTLFLNFSELIILRLLKAHADPDRDVVRMAQMCAGTAAEILPPDVVIRVLKPLIKMGDYPINQSAISMLGKLVEAHPPAIVAATLPEIMPGLVTAYDNENPRVRKESVFCMVSLHNSVGEEPLQPYLEELKGSKLKLLHFYIQRSDANHSSGSSSLHSEPHS